MYQRLFKKKHYTAADLLINIGQEKQIYKQTMFHKQCVCFCSMQFVCNF